MGSIENRHQKHGVSFQRERDINTIWTARKQWKSQQEKSAHRRRIRRKRRNQETSILRSRRTKLQSLKLREHAEHWVRPVGGVQQGHQRTNRQNRWKGPDVKLREAEPWEVPCNRSANARGGHQVQDERSWRDQRAAQKDPITCGCDGRYVQEVQVLPLCGPEDELWGWYHVHWEFFLRCGLLPYSVGWYASYLERLRSLSPLWDLHGS